MINAKLFSRRFKVEKELVKNMVMELVTKKLVKQIGVDGVEGKKAALDVTFTPVQRLFFLAYWCAFSGIYLFKMQAAGFAFCHEHFNARVM